MKLLIAIVLVWGLVGCSEERELRWASIDKKIIEQIVENEIVIPSSQTDSTIAEYLIYKARRSNMEKLSDKKKALENILLDPYQIEDLNNSNLPIWEVLIRSSEINTVELRSQLNDISTELEILLQTHSEIQDHRATEYYYQKVNKITSEVIHSYAKTHNYDLILEIQHFRSGIPYIRNSNYIDVTDSILADVHTKYKLVEK